jgi:hypothetical protein
MHFITYFYQLQSTILHKLDGMTLTLNTKSAPLISTSFNRMGSRINCLLSAREASVAGAATEE